MILKTFRFVKNKGWSISSLIKLASVTIINANDSYSAGKAISTELNEKDLCGIFVLSEGLNINGSELVNDLNTINRENIVITGGLAGDGSHFKKTWTRINDEILTDEIVAIGFYSYGEISPYAKGNCDLHNQTMTLTSICEEI